MKKAGKFMVSVGKDDGTLQFANLETCDGISVGKETVEVRHGGKVRLFDRRDRRVQADLIDLILLNYLAHDANFLCVQGGLMSLDDFTGEMRQWIIDEMAK